MTTAKQQPEPRRLKAIIEIVGGELFIFAVAEVTARAKKFSARSGSISVTIQSKPSIVPIIGKRLDLRKAGKEYVGLCPFHADNTPSLHVNEDKGVFHCFGCGESGDVFDFIMKLDGITFVEAVKSLGGDPSYRPQRRAISREAIVITNWCNAQFAKAQSILRETGQQMQLAKELGCMDEVERLSREWKILSIFADDLQNPKLAISLFESVRRSRIFYRMRSLSRCLRFPS